MLCYRCGSHVPDGCDTCATCGQKIAFDTAGVHTPGASLTPRKPTSIPHETSVFKDGDILASRFRILSFIGAGPVGQVYKALDQETDLTVAIKAVSPRLMQTPDERKSFSREIRLARKLAHPNLVRIYDEGSENNWPFFTMQLIEGPTLRQIIDLRRERKEFFKLHELEPIFSALAAALTATSEVGPHCGVKPENIVVLPDELKLTGFGLGMALPRLPFVAAQKSCGTHIYLAPEFTASEDSITVRADVYSMGVIMGEMLADVLPDKDQVPDPRSKNPALPPELTALYKRTLNENPLCRPGTPAEFLKELTAIITEFDSGLTEESTPIEIEVVPPQLPPGISAGSGAAPLSATVPPPIPKSSQIKDGDRPRKKSQEHSIPPQIPVIPGTSSKSSERKTGEFSAVKTSDASSESPAKKKKQGSPIPTMILGSLLIGGILCAGYVLFMKPDAAPTEPSEPVPAAVTPGPAAAVVPPAVTETADAGSTAAADSSTEKPREPEKQIQGKWTAASQKTPAEKTATKSPQEQATAGDAGGEKKISAAASKEDKKEDPTPSETKTETKKENTVAETKPEVKNRQPKGTRLDDSDDVPKQEKQKAERDSSKKQETSKSAGANGCPSKNMVLIPAGTFSAGTASDDPMRSFGERGIQRIKVPAYCIDTYEFPNVRGKTPKGKVSFKLAEAACEREGKRLCTEDEWERACKGPHGYVFPYDNTFQSGKCNTQDSYGTSQDLKPSGSSRYCSSGFNVFDLSGNVAEWTSTPYTSKGTGKVIKGGAANRPDYASRCSARRNGPTNKSETDEMVGFRCCADPVKK